MCSTISCARNRGDGGDARPNPILAYQRARRGAGAAERFLGPHRAQHPALPATGKRHHAHHRSVGRLLLCRASHRRSRGKAFAHIEEIEAMGGMAKAIEAGSRNSASRKRPPRHRRASTAGRSGDRRQQIQTARRSAIEILKVDTARFARGRSPSSNALRASAIRGRRRGARCADANAAGGNANLLALAVEAARAKATVGEISLALEKVFGRHRAEIEAVSGVYRREVGMSQAIIRVKGVVEASTKMKGGGRASLSRRSARTGMIAARK